MILVLLEHLRPFGMCPYIKIIYSMGSERILYYRLEIGDCMKHKHHIVPRHAGGTNEPDNLVLLSVEEHAEAHRKLYEEHGRWQDRLAWHALSGWMNKEEIIQEKLSQNGREVCKKRWTSITYDDRLAFRKKCSDSSSREPKTERHKAALRGPRPHVNQSGSNNNFAKRIKTPHGIFGSLREASITLNMKYDAVFYRLKYKKPEWEYL